MERKLGILAECIRSNDPADNLKLMHDAGFNCYMIDACNIALENASRIVEAGNALGMTCESLHSPFKGINYMWQYGLNYLTVYNGIKTAIDTASALAIPTVVVHVSSGWDAPQVNDLGLSRYDAIVDYAAEKGVKIAFENLRMVGNLACLADRYARFSHVGFCYDFGHEHCYTETVRWMDIFKNRLLTTHIHDNNGRPEDPKGDGDLHLMPFEGNVDYAECVAGLDKYGYEGALVLELTNARYEDMDPNEFITKAYASLKKIADMSK